jgi:hypothetical protein
MVNQVWDRLEPNGTDETLVEGLQARVADPLWMLARQWQSGEFDGEDAATPIRAEVTTEFLPITTLTGHGGKRIDFRKTSVPLEALVEAVSPSRFSAQELAGIVARGWAWLAEAGMDTPRIRALIRTAYPVRADAFDPDHPMPAAAQRRLRMLIRHGFNALAMAADGGAALSGRAELAAGDRRKLEAFAKALRRAVSALGHSAAQDGAEAWNGYALGYGATLSTRLGETQVDFSLSDYGGGRLDWYSFDRVEAVPDPMVHPAKVTRESRSMIPLPLTYAGQPVQRFWEFEDGAVQYGAINAGPGDISRMLVADFAAMGGDDMFVLPIEAPVGSLIRIKSLRLRDGFGRTHRIGPARHVDGKARTVDELPFDLFALGGPEGKSAIEGDWLPILPVVANMMNGRALEKVTLRRDEDANLAWAVEEEVEGAFGRAVRRRSAWQVPQSAEPTAEQEAVWPYRLQTHVPPWWIPLVPERIGQTAATRLRRARMGIWETLDQAVAGPRSRLMDPDRAVVLAEHAVPASGVRISRHWQVARGYDGRPILWQSWLRQAGAEDRVSGLRFDMIDRNW